MRSAIAQVLFLVLGLAPGIPAQASHLEPEHGLPGAIPGTERWIVELKERPFDLLELRRAFRRGASRADLERIMADLEEKARAHQADLARFAAGLGGRVFAHWWLINACALELPHEHLEGLRKHELVRRIYPDRIVRPGGAPIKKSTDLLNHAADLPQGQGRMGKGVVIAIPDTGFDINYQGGGKPNHIFYVKGNQNNTSGGGIQGSRIVLARHMGYLPTVPSIDTVADHGTRVAAVAGGEKWAGSPHADQGQAPEASFALYCWAIDLAGGTTLGYMVTTWQQVVSDKASHNILVANNSFMGSAPPTWVEQQAMDSAALNGDIFIAAMGGNFGCNPPTSTHYSNGATNVLAVGSLTADTRKVSSFSSCGPLWYSASPHPAWQRYYPDLTANGELLRMPNADGTDYQGSGTSYATPQVVGAAALYRQIRTKATALETRAAILASLQDVTAANRTAPANDRNAYGMGYLRTDRVVQFALGAGTVFAGAVTAASQTAKFKYTVKAGRRYAAVLSWDRYNLGFFDYSDLDLEIKSGATTLAKAATHLGNTNERAVFQAKAAGTVEVQVSTAYLENTASVSFCIALVEEGRPYTPGATAAVGAGCKGSYGGGLTPQLTVAGLHLPGAKYSLLLSDYNVTGSAALVLCGVSRTIWSGVKLPLDLAPIGAPGCFLRTDPVLAIPPFFGGVDINLPNNPDLLGARVYHQGLVVDPPANQAGLALSNALEVTVGVAF